VITPSEHLGPGFLPSDLCQIVHSFGDSRSGVVALLYCYCYLFSLIHHGRTEPFSLFTVTVSLVCVDLRRATDSSYMIGVSLDDGKAKNEGRAKLIRTNVEYERC
jgi:hypothetical protein